MFLVIKVEEVLFVWINCVRLLLDLLKREMRIYRVINFILVRRVLIF